jgi:hypothetical protein
MEWVAVAGMSERRTKLMATGLAVLGCLQLTGDVTGLLPLKALGAASHASPAPKVFTAHQGLETFAARFVIGWQDATGARHALDLTPRVNRRLRGPYNRRNTFGAAIAGGPMLQASPLLRPMHDAMLQHAFCSRHALLTEVGVRDHRGPYTLDIVLPARALAPALRSPAPWQLHTEITCHEK